MTLYTIEQEAKELGISTIGLRRKVKKGEIPYRRIGSLYRFTPEDLTAYLEAAAVPAKKAIHE